MMGLTQPDDVVTVDNGFDYYETVVGVCRVIGCDWTTEICWSDLERGGEAETAYAAHWQDAHA